MRFTITSAVLAFATSVLAQTEGFNPINVPDENEVVPAGSTFEVKWDVPAEYSEGTITISLIGGASQDTLVPIDDIQGGVPNSAGSYEWAVDPSLGSDAIYGLVMKLDSNPDIFQYSKPFQIGAGKGDGNGDKGKQTKTLTTATGVQTVTLSSCPPTSTWTTSTRTHHNTTTSCESTTSETSTVKPSSIYTPPPPPPPSTTPAPPPPPPQEPTQPEPEPTPEPTQPEPPAPTAAGAHLVAGPVALIGGLAVAFLAL